MTVSPAFETIVVSLDGTDFSARALPVGAALAREVNAGLRVVGMARSDAELVWVYDHVHDTAHLPPPAVEPTVDIIVDPDPAGVLLEIAKVPSNVLCFASHDRMTLATKLMHAVGSRVIERASHPFVIVGANAEPRPGASDVVVALDGVHDPEPMLSTAVAWARQLHASVRIVTVYEPVPADLRDPTHFSRDHGPPGDPDAYLETMQRLVIDLGAATVTAAAIPDAVSVPQGLTEHLLADPPQLVVIGKHRRKFDWTRGVLRGLLPRVPAPVLVVDQGP